MGSRERIINAIRAIEDGLGGRIALDDMAGAACLSPFHFHRVFSAVVGEPPATYIRKRRMTLAADQLLGSRLKVIDIALDWQFNSPEAFSRTFARQFGMSPSAYRKAGRRRDLLCRAPITEQELEHRIKGAITMKPVIVQKGEIKLVGMTVRHTLETPQYTALWARFMPRQAEIKNAVSPNGYEVCCTDPGSDMAEFNERTEFSTMAAVEVKDFSAVPAGMTTRVIPPAKYAVFTHKGPMSAMKMTYDYIFGTWAAGGEHELAAADDFALYDDRFKAPESPDNELDIYVPIKK